MDTQLIGLTISTIGEVTLAVTILFVHHKVKKEQKIDQYAIAEITHEEFLGVASSTLIILGYFLLSGFVSF